MSSKPFFLSGFLSGPDFPPSPSSPDIETIELPEVGPIGHSSHSDYFGGRTGRRALSVIVLIASLLISNAVLSEGAQADGHEFAGYINSTALNVRSGPGTKSDVIGILLKYDPVTVTGARNVGSTTWYSIKASGGYTNGWVSAHYIVRGAPPAGASEGPVDYGAKETPTLMRGSFQYVGAKTCQECHEDAVGEYEHGASGVWKSHFHSSAFQTLKRDYTKEIAQRGRGIDDPTTDWRCVKCHVTALGAAPGQLGPDYSQEEGVGCEVCHGPGGSYAEEDHGPDVANRGAMGFRVLRNLDDRREVCTSCHNAASPTYKPFDLRQFSRKIAHWVDDDDNAYRAEAGRESERRATAVTAGAAGAAGAAAGAATKAAGSAGSAASDAAATAAKAASKSKADAEAASRAAQDRAEAEASRRSSEAAAAKAEADRKAEAARATAAKKKADQAAADKRAAEAKAQAAAKAAEQERKDQQARAAAQAAKAKEEAAAAAAAAAAKAKAAAPPPPPPTANNPLAHYLDDVDDVIEMNTNGVKYVSMKFAHKKHAGNDYLPSGDCQTCHHTQEGNDSPESCDSCHDIDGDAEETKAKKRFVHTKKKGFPRTGDQEETSCVGCHASMNKKLSAGERTGEKAPTKCTLCHAKQ